MEPIGDGLKIAGHTLGTPDQTVDEALRMFADLGLDGAEIIWQDGYRSAIPESDHSEADRIAGVARDLGIEIVCLTPYITGLSSFDDVERDRDIARLDMCIEIAHAVGSPAVRVYAGSFDPATESELRVQKWQRLVSALRRSGEKAGEEGVSLCVENHFSTLAVTAAETVALVEAVSSPAVAILYDQANLSFTHSEPHPVAIAMQAPWIRHVQVKDFEFVDSQQPFRASSVHVVDASERTVKSRPPGQGILDWPAIVAELHRIGYAGFLSLEYEYRWHRQDLPEPRIGFEIGARHLRTALEALGEK